MSTGSGSAPSSHELGVARAGTSLGTDADDYDTGYYDRYDPLVEGGYEWSNPHWQQYFTTVASRIVASFRPTSSLDVGCAKGLLVRALREQGVDARGADISSAAIEAADPETRPYVAVRSATEPIEGRYDLITCIETLEHMTHGEAATAVARITAATDLVLFSSTPDDFREPTHVNIHPTADWVALFAERGFFRRTDVDTTFLAPWAVAFERGNPTIRDVVHRYESWVAPLQAENREARAALIEASRADEGADLRAQLEQARHDQLTIRDRILGLEAAADSARRDKARAERHAAEAMEELRAVRASTTWRIGTAVLRPAVKFRR